MRIVQASFWFENGLPGELFITMAKEGSTIGGLMDGIGTAPATNASIAARASVAPDLPDNAPDGPGLC